MAGPGPILREIHRIRRHLKDLQNKGEQGPRQVKAQQNKLAKDEEKLKQAHDIVKHDRMKIHEKEVSIKATQTEIEKYEKQIGEITSKKEYDALRAEIAAARERIKKIEDDILVLMMELEEKSTLVPEAEKALKKAKDDVAQFERDQSEKMRRWEEEKIRAQQELEQVEATLPEDVKAIYLRIVASKGEDGIAGVQGQSCTACYTEVTAQMANELRRDLFVICKNCGRMLYMVA